MFIPQTLQRIEDLREDAFIQTTDENATVLAETLDACIAEMLTNKHHEKDVLEILAEEYGISLTFRNLKNDTMRIEVSVKRFQKEY